MTCIHFLTPILNFTTLKRTIYLIAVKTKGGRKTELKNSLDAIANQILEILATN